MLLLSSHITHCLFFFHPLRYKPTCGPTDPTPHPTHCNKTEEEAAKLKQEGENGQFFFSPTRTKQSFAAPLSTSHRGASGLIRSVVRIGTIGVIWGAKIQNSTQKREFCSRHLPHYIVISQTKGREIRKEHYFGKSSLPFFCRVDVVIDTIGF